MSGSSAPPEWRLYAHPAFANKFEELIRDVDKLRARDSANYAQHPKAKLLRRILDLMQTEIQAN